MHNYFRGMDATDGYGVICKLVMEGQSRAYMVSKVEEDRVKRGFLTVDNIDADRIIEWLGGLKCVVAYSR